MLTLGSCHRQAGFKEPTCQDLPPARIPVKPGADKHILADQYFHQLWDLLLWQQQIILTPKNQLSREHQVWQDFLCLQSTHTGSTTTQVGWHSKHMLMHQPSH